MFGRDLDETMAVEARLGGSYVPILVHRCAKFIREHGECACACVCVCVCVCVCMCLCVCVYGMHVYTMCMQVSHFN